MESKPEGKGQYGLTFDGQCAIECTVGFRIDSRTIKRGSLKQLRLSSATW